ncbi:MAG: metal ABC transporter substrate-binding protein [Actinomycetota bacterium]|nr:metal ABC transporter substrate-binding protein [Actinomycetota bacterium]
MPRLLALPLLLVALAGCDAGPAGSDRAPAAPAPEAGAGVTAVATVFPLAWVVEQVAPSAEVTLVGGGGRDPHDLELSPADRTRLESADVLAYLGDIGFQPQVEEAVRASGGQIVSAAQVAGDERLLTVDEGQDAVGPAVPDAAREGPVDPHLWFDPAIMADVALRTGEAFAAADPAGTRGYRANAEAVHDALATLDTELDALLDSCRFEEVIVSHEAYAYLLEPHGLRQKGLTGAGGHVEASPRRIADLSAEVRAEGLPAVLVEPVEGRAEAEAVGAETGVELVDIYSLDIVTDDQAAKGLVRLLREQAQAVARAAGCSGHTGGLPR